MKKNEGASVTGISKRKVGILKISTSPNSLFTQRNYMSIK